MLENSKDILNWALGISVFMVALLFSWLLYQIGKTVKSANDTIKIAQKIVNNLDKGVESFKNKAGNLSAFLTVFGKGAQEVVKAIQKKKTKKDKKQK
ncbi:MAG: hypothetical protein PHO91_04525 [Patescibacteria group bacterium]|nr:hypothetical protein [Patescibacteria group bacterium]